MVLKKELRKSFPTLEVDNIPEKIKFSFYLNGIKQKDLNALHRLNREELKFFIWRILQISRLTPQPFVECIMTSVSYEFFLYDEQLITNSRVYIYLY